MQSEIQVYFSVAYWELVRLHSTKFALPSPKKKVQHIFSLEDALDPLTPKCLNITYPAIKLLALGKPYCPPERLPFPYCGRSGGT